MTTRAQALRQLINSGERFIVGDTYNALTARIVEHVGFKCAYLGGHACGAMNFAVPDYGVVTQSEQIEQASRIVQAIDIPLIVDADTLGETPADAYRFTRMYERIGVAGLHVEDEQNPRHSTFDHGLISITEMQLRLAACLQAREHPAFLIIARCDELYDSSIGGGGKGDMSEAIERGLAYAEAGADMLVYPMAKPEQIATLSESLPVPLCTLGPLRDGAIFALQTGWALGTAAKLHLEQARQLLETGSLPPYSVQFEGKEQLLRQDTYGSLIRNWSEKTGRAIR